MSEVLPGTFSSISELVAWKRESSPVAQIETKGVLGVNDVLARLLPLFASGSASTPQSALALYDQSSSVSIPIDWVADPCADIEPVLEKDGKFDTDHDVLSLLRTPSPDYTGRQFRDVLGHDYLITGEAFVAATGDPGRPPIDLQPLSPTAMGADMGVGGFPDSWDVTGNTMAGRYDRQVVKRSARYIDPRNPGGAELKQIRRYSTKDNSLLRGQSPLVAASREAKQHMMGLLHNTSLLENGGRGSLVFKYQQQMSDDDWEATLQRLSTQYGGAGNAGKIMAEIAEDLEIIELGKSNRDMDFAKLQDMAQRAVALQYKVPLPLVTTDASTFANFEAAILALYDYAVLPLFRRIHDPLSDFLLPRFNLDPAKVRIGFDPNSITALMTRRVDELTKRRALYVESGNELRGLLGREEAADFDVIYQPGNLVPAGSDIFTDDNATKVEV